MGDNKNRKHIFALSVAVELGLNEAIVISEIHGMINHVKRNIRNHPNYKYKYYHRGMYWANITLNELAEHIPFLSRKTIIKALKSLEDDKILMADKFNKHKYDQTKWYTIDYDKYFHMAQLD